MRMAVVSTLWAASGVSVPRGTPTPATCTSAMVATMIALITSVFTLHSSSSLSCINEYLAIDSGGYVYEQPPRINCSI